MPRIILLLSLIVSMVFSTVALAQVRLGEVPPVLALEGAAGGKIDGTAWSSNELQGKLWILFYVDPDEKDLNEPLSEALAAKKFPKEQLSSLAIINMDATWLPNAVLNSSLASKQKKYPKTVYVKDFKKALVKSWGLADDSSHIVLFDKEGKVLHSQAGKHGPEDIQKVLSLIEQNL